jgi:hypothetical protein
MLNQKKIMLDSADRKIHKIEHQMVDIKTTCLAKRI